MTRRKAITVAKPPVTWILVADSKQAQVYTRQRIEKLLPLSHNQFEEAVALEPVPVAGMKWEAESAEAYDVHMNQLGRMHESANTAHHMSEPRLTVHEEIMEHFAKEIGEQLNLARDKKSFDRLVLIAPAKMLGQIKKDLNTKARKCVVAEMPKDLTHYEGPALAKHLDGII
jgi:protein required for attachment to host cells